MCPDRQTKNREDGDSSMGKNMERYILDSYFGAKWEVKGERELGKKWKTSYKFTIT